jgi:hypothetical protein
VQKSLHLFRLAGQDLLQQVVQNVTVRAREPFDKPEYVFTIAHRDRCHLQAGNLAFGALFEERTDPASRLRLMTSFRNWAASGLVKRRSAARSSTAWARPRKRARGGFYEPTLRRKIADWI